MLRSIVVKFDGFPLTGRYQVQVRLHGRDKKIVDMAASAMELSQSDLCRALLVNGSKEILKQYGIKEPVTPIKVHADEQSDEEDTQSILGAGDSD